MNKKAVANTFLGMLLTMGLLLTMAWSPAEASRIFPGHTYADKCKNVKGVQPIWSVQGYTAIPTYKFIRRTPRPHDCTWANRLRHLR